MNVLRRRLEVVETAYERRDGTVSFNSYTKTNAGRRVVPLPAIVLETLGQPKDPDALVFTRPSGGALRRSMFRERVWVPARTKANLPNLTPHHLRHYAISLWVSHGIDLTRVKTWSGHSQLRMLDVYSHFMPDDQRDDRMMEAFDAIAREARRKASGE